MHHPTGHAIGRMTAGFCALLLVAFFIGPAAAQEVKPLKGVALIIGQSRYAHITPLANPANDARAVDRLLTALGFDTRTVSDRDTALLRRDLDRFAEDAQGADVALLYYSGHGIEAGGENYLVPTDADLSALDDAGEKLVPLSTFMERLKSSVPITVLLLDACRTNPFPAGTSLKARGGDQPAPIAAIGLGAPRGMSVVEDQPATESLGVMIGLAAEPGRAALDGEPGQNSPYAAALLKHLSAIKGEEFGTVMRMVTEEVYLATKTRQRPWINESIRRLLYFGGTIEEPGGPSGLITQERRHLLLTISGLPTAERKQVETIAAKDSVPLDALYGVLHSLGIANIPRDPEALEKLLRDQALGIKRLVAERDALQADNLEIKKLAAAAQDALDQGAIATARQFLDQAVKIVEQGRGSTEVAEARVKERRVADARVYGWRADTESLASDYLAAAKDYESAYGLVAKWDDALAWRYKFEVGNALIDEGKRREDMSYIGQAISAYQAALPLVSRERAPQDWGRTVNNLGNALVTLGEQDSGSEKLEQAAIAFRAVLEMLPRNTHPIDWGMTQINIGNVQRALGERETGTARLEEAAASYRAALESLTRNASPFEWAAAQNNLGNVLTLIADRDDGTKHLQEATEAYRMALEVRTREDMPLQWAVTQSNLGMALRSMGAREAGTEMLRASVDAYHSALEELTPKLAPLDWSMAQNNLGNVLTDIGQREGRIDAINEAVTAFRAALQQRRREEVPALWAQTQNNLGSALAIIGQAENDPAALTQSAEALRAVLDVRSREAMPYQWALTQTNLGSVLQMLGNLTNDPRILAEAVDAHRTALLEFTRDRAPQEWLRVQNNLGNALRSLGEREKGTATLNQALAAFRAAFDGLSRDQSPQPWARTQFNIGLTLLSLARRGGGRKTASQAIQAFEAARDVFREARDEKGTQQAESFLAEAHALRH
jgi:uncharacterized caspase-like protein